MTTMTLNAQPTAARSRRISRDELSNHAANLGIDTSLIKVDDIVTPDCVTVTIGRPDGRSLRHLGEHALCTQINLARLADFAKRGSH